MSKAFDAYLRLEGPDGKTVAKDDDGGEGLNARIIYRVGTAGNYRIIATTANGRTGPYVLSVQLTRLPKAQLLVLKDGKAEAEGRLTKDDPTDEVLKRAPHRAYALKCQAGRTYRIDMMSKELDSYLRLEGPDGKTVAQDDDSGGKLDARIVFRAPTSGTYRISATVNNPERLGSYSLAIQEGPAPPTLVLTDGVARAEGKLTRDDPVTYGFFPLSPHKAYLVKLEADQDYRIDLASKRFDTFLRLEGPDGAVVASNDDGDDLNAHIAFRPRVGGTYQVIVTTTATPIKVGPFTLTVQKGK
jgi:hypothetical protein